MNKITTYAIIALHFCVIFKVNSQSSLWTKNGKSVHQKPNTVSTRNIYALDVRAFKEVLQTLSYSKKAQTKISFPGFSERNIEFRVSMAHTMHPDLARKFPNLQTYKGIANDGSGTVIRFTFAKKGGLRGYILNPDQSKVEINPVGTNDHAFHFRPADEGWVSDAFECNTIEKIQSASFFRNPSARDIDDSKLRRYRLALSSTGEYAQFFLDGTETNDAERKEKVLQAMVTSVNRINEVFERDAGITLELVADTDELIYLNPNTDPYPSQNDHNREIQNTIDSVIGNDSYDVGHAFGHDTITSGNAGCIACVCTPGSKGSAYTNHVDPSSDDMNNIALHEFGHQFGAFHTQSSRYCRSGFNSEVEPGSGSTIMSYAGICPPNIQELGDFYFNYTSIRDMAIWTINNSSCAELIDIQNMAPVVDAGPDYTIPVSTPFVLEGTASDTDSEQLTYCWEQNDPENPNTTSPPTSNQLVGPVFRSFPPGLSNKRYIPQLATVVSGQETPWEVLPSVARDLTFSLTVRDLSDSNGQVVTDLKTITVDAKSGPFTVNSQSTPNEVWTVGEPLTVTWNVGDTDKAPINSDTVDIILSTDGGVSFDTVIAEDVPNTGTATFTLPEVNTTERARLMVKPTKNIFYAVNTTDFSIEKSEFTLTTEAPVVEGCEANTIPFTFIYKTFLGFEEEITFSTVDLPTGVTVSFSPSRIGGDHSTGTAVELSLSGVNTLENGGYTFSVEGRSSRNLTKRLELELRIFNTINENPVLQQPTNGSLSLDINTDLIWQANVNANTYRLQISEDELFASTVFTDDLSTNQWTAEPLSYNKQYYWRVQYLNSCSSSAFSDIFSFTTKCEAPKKLEVTQVSFTSVDVAWNGSADSYLIEYGDPGFSPGNGTSLQSNTNSVILSGLTSGTSYDVYISGNCSIGGNSDVAGPLRIQTAVDYCSGDLFYDTGGASGLYQNNENYTTTIFPGDPNQRVRIRFDFFDTESFYDTLHIYDGDDTDGTLIQSLTGTYSDIEFKSNHESGALTFVFSSDNSVTSRGWEASITCEPKPNCVSPANFIATEIFARTTTLSWQDESSEIWTLEYGEKGFAPGSGVQIIADETIHTLESLEPNTAYEVYLKANCPIGGFSDTIGPVEINTLVACPAPQNFMYTDVQPNSIQLAWRSPGVAQQWILEYGQKGFELGSGTVVTTDETTLLLEGLSANTEYDIHLKADCNDEGFSLPVQLSVKTYLNLCGNHFYDTGGPLGNYENNENYTVTLTPESAEDRVRVTFNALDLGYCCDNLVVYDGPDTYAPRLVYLESLPSESLVSTHESGTLTFQFVSNSYDAGQGWDATVICEPKPNCLPPSDVYAYNVQAKSATLGWYNSNDSETEWTVEYGPEGFVVGEGNTTVLTEQDNNIENLLPNTRYQLYLKTNCSEGGFSDLSDRVTFQTQIACFSPTDIVLQSVTNNQATITWETATNAENYEIEYSLGYSSQGEGTIVQTTDNQVVLDSLQSNSSYSIYIRAHCGDDGYSSWSYRWEFTTKCDVQNAPFTESFTTFYDQPECWEISDRFDWRFSGAASGEAASVRDRNPFINSAFAHVEGNLPRVKNNVILTSPAIDISNLVSPSVQFAVFSKNTQTHEYNTLEVYANDVDSGTKTKIYEWSGNTEQWQDVVVDLKEFPNVDSVFSLSFEVRYYGISTTETIADLLIDEVKIDELPRCTRPRKLNLKRTSTRLAQIEWEALGTEEDWEIQYREQGTLNPYIDRFSKATTYEIVGLRPNTNYEVLVRAVCAIGEVSEFIGPLYITTDCYGFDVPYHEGFSNRYRLPECYLDKEGNWMVSNRRDPVTGTSIPDRSSGQFGRYMSKRDGIMEASVQTPSFDIKSLVKPSLQFSIWSSSTGRSSDEYSKVRVDMLHDTGWTSIFEFQEASEGWRDVYLDLSAYAISDSVKFRFTVEDTNAPGVVDIILIDELAINELPDCIAPYNVRQTSAFLSSMTLSWDSTVSDGDWQVQYGTAGFLLGEGTVEDSNSKTVTLTDLSTDTVFDVYVRERCSATLYSDWVGPIPMRTTSNFCGEHFYDSGGANGPYSNSSNQTTVIVPNVKENRVRVTFNSVVLESCCDELQVYDGPSAFSPLIGRVISNAPNEFVSTHESGALTFVFTSDRSVVRDGWDASITCEPKPEPCATPTGFVLLDVDNTSAELSWANDSEVSDWTLVYGATGSNLNITGIKIRVTENNATLTNLIPGTSYSSYVRANCTSGEHSRPSEKITFFTIDNACRPNVDNLLVNGSFECGMTGWISNKTFSTGDCNTVFASLSDSNTLCSVSGFETIVPTDQDLAAIAGFDDSERDIPLLQTLTQVIQLPENMEAYERISFGYDSKGVYDFENNEVRWVGVTIRSADLSKLLYSSQDIEFGAIQKQGNFDIRVRKDNLLKQLKPYAGQNIQVLLVAYDRVGISGASVILFDNVHLTLHEKTLHIPDVRKAEEMISVYPNPNQGSFYIAATEKIREVEIFSMSGRLIQVVQTQPLSKIQVRVDLPSGSYFIKINTENGFQLKQILIH